MTYIEYYYHKKQIEAFERGQISILPLNPFLFLDDINYSQYTQRGASQKIIGEVHEKE